jgi:hypothetical protein
MFWTSLDRVVTEIFGDGEPLKIRYDVSITVFGVVTPCSLYIGHFTGIKATGDSHLQRTAVVLDSSVSLKFFHDISCQ